MNESFEKRPISTLAEVDERLRTKFELGPQFELTLQLTHLRLEQLTLLLGAQGDMSVLRGKKVLDLGCGSKTSTPIETPGRPNSKNYEPWLCRALQEIGAEPTGVDIEDLENEPFVHYKIDLTKPDALSVFPNDSFDVVNTSFLIGKEHASPRIWRLTEKEEEKVQQALAEQAARVLTEGGVFAENQSFFIKREGVLVPVQLKDFMKRRDDK